MKEKTDKKFCRKFIGRTDGSCLWYQNDCCDLSFLSGGGDNIEFFDSVLCPHEKEIVTRFKKEQENQKNWENLCNNKKSKEEIKERKEMKEGLRCPIDGGTNIRRSGIHENEFVCCGCGYEFTLDTIAKKKEDVFPIWIKTKPESQEPKIIKCSNCDWKTTESVKICERCGINLPA
ncbi:MAG: hypothetical protein ACFFB0_22340 [Promethearchaeota archaeon]